MGSGTSGGIGLHEPSEPGDTGPSSNQVLRRSSLGSRWPRLLSTFLAICGLGCVIFIAIIVWVFWRGSQPLIESASLSLPVAPSQPLCPGQEYTSTILVQINKSPGIVAITENWVNQADTSITYLDEAPEWRIIDEPPSISTFTITSTVPAKIRPGLYEYKRALGLSRPLIIRQLITVGDC